MNRLIKTSVGGFSPELKCLYHKADRVGLPVTASEAAGRCSKSPPVMQA
jgi:hypothetical protein